MKDLETAIVGLCLIFVGAAVVTTLRTSLAALILQLARRG